ncbi:MAG: hypothetical protein Q9181_007493 [Wetmoreana brouardii]
MSTRYRILAYAFCGLLGFKLASDLTDPIRKLITVAIPTIDALKVISSFTTPPSLTALSLGNSNGSSYILFILMTLWACWDIFREVWGFFYCERLPSIWMLPLRLLFGRRRSTRQTSPDNSSSIDTTRVLEAAVEHLERVTDGMIKKHRIEKEGLLETIDRKDQEHRAIVDTHQATVATLHESISAKDAYIDRLHSEKEATNAAAASANKRHQAEKKELQQTIDRQAEEHRAAIGSFPAQVADLESRLARAESSLQRQTEALKTAQDSFQASQDADRSTIHNLRNQILETSGQRDEAERKLRKSDSEVARLQAATSSITSMLEDGREKATEKESALTAIKEEKKNLARTNGTLLKDRQDLKARNDQLSTALDRKTSELEQASRDIAALHEAAKHSVPRTELEKIHKLRDEQEEELTATLQDEADELYARIPDADRRVAGLKKAKKTRQVRERNCRRASREAEIAASQQKAKAESLRKQIGSATDALAAKEQEISEANGKISATARQSQADKKSLEDKVSGLTNKLSKAKDEISALKASLGDKDSEIRELQQAALPDPVEYSNFEAAQAKGPKEAKRFVVTTLRAIYSARIDLEKASAAEAKKASEKTFRLEAEVAELRKKLRETKAAAEKAERATSWTIAKLKDDCKSKDADHESNLDADDSLTPEKVHVAKPESLPPPQSIPPPTPIVFGSPLSASSSVPAPASPSPEPPEPAEPAEPAEPSKPPLSHLSSSKPAETLPLPKQSTPSSSAVARSNTITPTQSSHFTSTPPYQPPKSLPPPSTNVTRSSTRRATRASNHAHRSPLYTPPPAPTSRSPLRPSTPTAPRPGPWVPREILRVGRPKDDDLDSDDNRSRIA